MRSERPERGYFLNSLSNALRAASDEPGASTIGLGGGAAAPAGSVRRTGRIDDRAGRRRRGAAIACHSNARRKQGTLVGLVLQRDARRNRLQALKSRGRLEMGALLAAMQRGVTFRTVAVPIDPVRQLRGTTETASCGHCLYEAWQARTSY